MWIEVERSRLVVGAGGRNGK